MNNRFFVSFFIMLAATMMLAQQTKTQEYHYMTLKRFMEEYTKPATKLYRRGQKEPLIELIEIMPELALEKDREDWRQIIEKAKKAGNLRKSCRACHKRYKRRYKRTYKKRLVQIPSNLRKTP